MNTLSDWVPAALVSAVAMVGCTTARVLEPSQENLRDPLSAFVVAFDSNYKLGSFKAILDPDTPGEIDLTTRFNPAPTAGGRSAVSIEEPFVGGTHQSSTNRYSHTLKLYSDSKVDGGGYSLEKQRDRVEFFPVHVVFKPNVIDFQLAGNGAPDVCLQPVPTHAVEVMVSLGEGSVPLSLNNGLEGQPVLVSVLPSADGKSACTHLRVSARRKTPVQPPSFILGSCNGCQRGSALVRVM